MPMKAGWEDKEQERERNRDKEEEILRCAIPVMLVQQQRILCITRTVEYNYISPSSTVGIQLHVLALYMGHLQVVI